MLKRLGFSEQVTHELVVRERESEGFTTRTRYLEAGDVVKIEVRSANLGEWCSCTRSAACGFRE